MLHNPWARTPVADGALAGFTEHRLQPDGKVLTTFRQPDVFVSQTQIHQGTNALQEARRQTEHYLLARTRT